MALTTIAVSPSRALTLPITATHALVPSGSRHFWWGRVGKKSNVAQSQKYVEAYHKLLRYRSSRFALPIQNTKHSWYLEQWKALQNRESSSWGGDHGKPSTTQEDKKRLDEDFLKIQYEKGQAIVMARLEELQTMFEKDPYRMLFGMREARGVWNPWRSYKESVKDDLRRLYGLGEEKPCESTGPMSSTPKTVAKDQALTHSNIEDYYIDPITLRKVQRPISDAVAASPELKTAEPGASVDESGCDIPVKKFVSMESMSDLQAQEVDALSSNSSSKERSRRVMGFATQPWLAREGFISSTTGPGTTMASRRTAPTNQLESSLNRHLREKESRSNSSPARKLENSANHKVMAQGQKDSTTGKKLEYNSAENTTEDIDLLRSSDVRASAGHVKPRPARESREAMEYRWKKVEDDFQTRQKQFEADFAKAKDMAKDSATVGTSSSHEALGSSSQSYGKTALGQSEGSKLSRELFEQISTTPVTSEIATESLEHVATTKQHELDNKFQLLENHYAQEQERQAREQAQEKKTRIAQQTLAEEVQKQRTAMDRHESFRSTATSDTENPPSAPSRSISNVPGIAPNPLTPKESDKALIREIRRIYEEGYGKIGVVAADQPNDLPAPAESNVQIGTVEAPTAASVPQSNSDANEMPTTASYVSSNPIITREEAQQTLEEAKTSLAAVEEVLAQVSKLKAPATMDEETCASSQFSMASSKRNKEKSAKFPAVYTILALSPRSGEVVVSTTTTTSLVETSPARSVPWILTHLHQPTKYFNLMQLLEEDGSELVAGTRKLLVYKKVVDGKSVDVKMMQKSIINFLEKAKLSTASSHIDDSPTISETTAVVIDSEAAASQNTTPVEANSTSTASKSPRVRREEGVFSAQSAREKLMTEAEWQALERERRETYLKFRTDQEAKLAIANKNNNDKEPVLLDQQTAKDVFAKQARREVRKAYRDQYQAAVANAEKAVKGQTSSSNTGGGSGGSNSSGNQSRTSRFVSTVARVLGAGVIVAACTLGTTYAIGKAQQRRMRQDLEEKLKLMERANEAERDARRKWLVARS